MSIKNGALAKAAIHYPSAEIAMKEAQLTFTPLAYHGSRPLEQGVQSASIYAQCCSCHICWKTGFNVLGSCDECQKSATFIPTRPKAPLCALDCIYVNLAKTGWA